MALDATVGGATANSYITEADATAYLTSSRLYISAWTSATLANKEVALIWATSLIDTSYEFEGSKWTLGQALRWPRIGAIDIDGVLISSGSVPEVLKRATALLALNLLTSNRMEEPALLGLGISEAKVGPMEVKIESGQVKETVPDEVRIMLASIGHLKGELSEHSGSVRLLRG